MSNDLRNAMRRIGSEPTTAEKVGHVIGLTLSLATGAALLYFGALVFGLAFSWRGIGGAMMVMGGWWAMKTGERPQ